MRTNKVISILSNLSITLNIVGKQVMNKMCWMLDPEINNKKRSLSFSEILYSLTFIAFKKNFEYVNGTK